MQSEYYTNDQEFQREPPRIAPQEAGIYAPNSPYSENECDEIITKLEALLDGELDSEKKIEVENMINGCGYCLEQYKIERSLKDLLKLGLSNLNVADQLVASIKNAMNKIRK